jgi:hypothetical protein
LIINNIATGTAPATPVFVGAFNLNGSVNALTYEIANFQALPIYDIDVSSYIAALYTAMAAL